MLTEYSHVLERIAAWWHCEDMDRPCIAFSMEKPNKSRHMDRTTYNDYWPSENHSPDLEGFVEAMIQTIDSTLYFGEALPIIPHTYGGRGTPMTIAFYLGGEVAFRPETVWVEPVIRDWSSFDISFNPENRWWKHSCDLLQLSVKESKGKYLPSLPDYGDALTTLSLLRGTQQLIYDIVDTKEVVIKARDEFLQIWRQYHYANWEVYRHSFPGDTSWLIWAPGKTYAAQCDFSTMLSPSLFEELVVPEIEVMGEYLDYIIWHLDGPDEIKYLDTLLALPEIRAIQWVPGAGKPTAVHWLDMLRRIQKHGKSLYVYAENECEVETLVRELSPKGLFISGGFTGDSVKEAEDLLRMVERLSSRP